MRTGDLDARHGIYTVVVPFDKGRRDDLMISVDTNEGITTVMTVHEHYAISERAEAEDLAREHGPVRAWLITHLPLWLPERVYEGLAQWVEKERRAA